MKHALYAQPPSGSWGCGSDKGTQAPISCRWLTVLLCGWRCLSRDRVVPGRAVWRDFRELHWACSLSDSRSIFFVFVKAKILYLSLYPPNLLFCKWKFYFVVSQWSSIFLSSLVMHTLIKNEYFVLITSSFRWWAKDSCPRVMGVSKHRPPDTGQMSLTAVDDVWPYITSSQPGEESTTS